MRTPAAMTIRGALRGLGRAAIALVLITTLVVPAPAGASSGDSLLLAARDAQRKRDALQLATLRTQLVEQGHPLASWADYWQMSLRLPRATPSEVEAFYARWSDTYVEDRLRNDWLLELGKRRDWQSFRRDYPRFKMNDDREVTCYAVLAEHLGGRPVRDKALEAWLAQRDADAGCQQMASTLRAAGVLDERDVWRKVRAATEQGKPGAARSALRLLGPGAGADAFSWEQPERTLNRAPAGRPADALDALAIARLAASDPDRARLRLEAGPASGLPTDWMAWAWAQVGRQAAVRLGPDAIADFRRAEAAALRARPSLPLTDETLEWQVRAALRAVPADWRMVRAGVDAMSEAGRRDPAWAYWVARANLAVAGEGPEGEAERTRAVRALGDIAGQLHFYGKLASEDLGRELRMPARPSPLTVAERDAAQRNAGLARALQLIALGLRSEGNREWNFSLRGMDDRQLLAAAQLACDRSVWDRCINTSDRTRAEIDVAQRFPMPFRDAVIAQASQAGIDPAYVYGLIRQESRFIMDARSSVGASGLMQLMPATASWTAKRLGMPYTAERINDRDTNLRLGIGYLKLLLDDFEGSQALAAAGYNAGPGRPRRWRDGPLLEPAIWAETIPFGETRDYVKKVLSNAVYYAAILGTEETLSLRARLGQDIGPRLAAVAPADRELP